MCDALPNLTADVHVPYMPRSDATLLSGCYPKYTSTRSTESNGERYNSPAIIGNGLTLYDHPSDDDKTSDQENDVSPILVDFISSPSNASVPLIKEMCISDIGDGGVTCRTAKQLPVDALRTTTTAGKNVSRDRATRANTEQDDNRKDGRNQHDRKSLSDSENISNGHEHQVNGVIPSLSTLVLTDVTMGSRHRSPGSCKEAHSTGQQHQSSRPDLRQVRLGNTILRIHSLESSSSDSYRNIRATLLQIRDSMQSPTATTAAVTDQSSSEPASDLNYLDGEGGCANQKTETLEGSRRNPADCCDDGLPSSNALISPLISRRLSSAAVEMSRTRSPPRRGKPRRPERLSLPSRSPYGRLGASLTSDGDDEDEETASAGTRTRRRLASRRHRTSVKFADDFGLNLNTFVMIPSRSRSKTELRSSTSSSSGDVTTTSRSTAVTGAARVSPSHIGDTRELFQPISYLKCLDEGDHDLIRTSGDVKMMPACELYRRRSLSHPPERPFTLDFALDSSGPSASIPCHATDSVSDGQSSVCGVARTADDTTLSAAVFDAPTSIIAEPQFRLCFDQPFADQERFRARLSAQMVCLENVRVDDWSPTGGVTATSPTSSPASSPLVVATNNSVMLCTIRVRNLHPEKRVYARCTDNNWFTFADLPAHHVGGIDSLGYEHDRFCFAVRRPLYDAALVDVGTEVEDSSARRRVAVEFAVCLQAAGRTYWDSNDGSNYRIEWY